MHDNPKTPEEERLAPERLREKARRQETDDPAVPRGNRPGAMCEDVNRPGFIDKTNDC